MVSKAERKRLKAKARSVIALPAPYGEKGIAGWAERERVRQMLERDRLAGLAAKKRHKSFGTFDTPSSLDNAVTINPNDPEERRRFRALPADHPLVRAWFNGKIDAIQFNAGNIYRLLFEKANDPSGRDSTQANFINRSVSGNAATLRTADVLVAMESLRKVDGHLSSVDRLIVSAFCGRRISMSAAVSGATRCSSNSVLFRVQEALSSLDVAIRAAGVERGPDHGAVAEYLKQTA